MYLVAGRVSLTRCSQRQRFSTQVRLPRSLVGVGCGHQVAKNFEADGHISYGITIFRDVPGLFNRLGLEHGPFCFVGEAGAGW